MDHFFSFMHRFAGREVGWRNFLAIPLTPHETIRESSKGTFRRLSGKRDSSPILEQCLFLLEIRFNPFGHLKAIDKLLTQFYEEMLFSSPFSEEKLALFQEEANLLKCLGNDYGFIILRQGDPAFIADRLEEMKREAYLIFSTHYHNSIKKERSRSKKNFHLFFESVESNLLRLRAKSKGELKNLPLFAVAMPLQLSFLFNNWINSFRSRKKTIDLLLTDFDLMREKRKNMFISSGFKNKLLLMEDEVNFEADRLQMELLLVVQEILKNHSISPFKEKIEALLCAIKIEEGEDHQIRLYA